MNLLTNKKQEKKSVFSLSPMNWFHCIHMQEHDTYDSYKGIKKNQILKRKSKDFLNKPSF